MKKAQLLVRSFCCDCTMKFNHNHQNLHESVGKLNGRKIWKKKNYWTASKTMSPLKNAGQNHEKKYVHDIVSACVLNDHVKF